MATQTMTLVLLRHSNGCVCVEKQKDGESYVRGGEFVLISEPVTVEFPLIDVPLEAKLATIEASRERARQEYERSCQRLDRDAAAIRGES